MNENKDKVIIFLWNLYVLFFYPLSILLASFWSIEISGQYPFRRGRGMPIAVLIIFVPEVIFGLKWNLNGSRMFTIICSIVDGLILHKLFQYYFVTLTDAPITYCILNIMIVLSLVWIIIIEFNQSLREHIIQYPQDEWLVPHAESGQDEYWHFFWKVLFFTAVGCLFMDVFDVF